MAHQHTVSGATLRNAFLLTLIILVGETAVGFVSNSLALLSDAGHILTDAVALGLAWYASRLASRPPDERRTFGYGRGGILAALANAAALLAIAILITVEALMRVRSPQHVDGLPVLIAAAVAIFVNSFIAFGLRRDDSHSLNVRAALAHVVGDIAASIGVVIGAVVILLWRSYVVDPILSVLIAGLIAYGGWQIIRDTLAILMESTPGDIDLDALKSAMREVPGVEDVHDLHVWSLSDGFRLLSAHITIPEQSVADAAALLADLKLLLSRRFGIAHATIETECVDCSVPQRRPVQLHQRRG